jgi:phosphate transport system permease protein
MRRNDHGVGVSASQAREKTARRWPFLVAIRWLGACFVPIFRWLRHGVLPVVGWLTNGLVCLFRWLASWLEPLIEWTIRICGWSAILFVLAIFAFVFREAFPILYRGLEGGTRPFNVVEFLTSAQWHPNAAHPRYGVLALVAGTLSVTIGSMVMAVPIGLGAAVYISEFCSGWWKESLKILIELLAAIPSIVWGFIGVVVIAPLIIEYTGAYVGVNVLNASLVLALMSVPVIVSVGEDSLKAVPDSYREAGLSMGASRWEVIYRVLFPAAKNGLLAAVLLGVGRAIGETMAVLLCTGHAVQIPRSLLDPTRTLTATIAAELGETAQGQDHYRVLFLIGVLLFTVTFAVNLCADLVVKGIRGK